MAALDTPYDPLQEVPSEDYPEMMQKLKNHLPISIHAQEYLRIILKRKLKRPELKVGVLAPEGNYKLGIIFFTLDEGVFSGSVYCHNDEEKNVLQKALASTKKVPIYNQKMSALTCMTSKSYEAVKPYLTDWPMYHDDLVFWLPWDSAKDIKLNQPEGTVIRNLSPEHAEQINKLWSYKYQGSRELIAEMITVNFGIGLFKDGKLLSWAIYFYYGGIGVVHTIDSERRKGYGRAVVESITKRMGEMQIDVHLIVVESNKTAQLFFRSLGFQHVFKAYWIESPSYDEESSSYGKESP